MVKIVLDVCFKCVQPFLTTLNDDELIHFHQYHEYKEKMDRLIERIVLFKKCPCSICHSFICKIEKEIQEMKDEETERIRKSTKCSEKS